MGPVWSGGPNNVCHGWTTHYYDKLEVRCMCSWEGNSSWIPCPGMHYEVWDEAGWVLLPVRPSCYLSRAIKQAKFNLRAGRSQWGNRDGDGKG